MWHFYEQDERDLTVIMSDIDDYLDEMLHVVYV